MIELFSANTPNGWKISIMLEEIDFKYKLTKVNLSGDQFKPEFKKISKRLIAIDNINKPLKTISSYKKPELEEWCKKLKIKYEFIGQKKATKNKLYALIQEKII